MFAKIVKGASLTCLLLALAVRRLEPEYFIVSQFVIFAGASVIVVQSIHERRYRWAAAFVAIAVFFNPIVILVPTQDGQFFPLVLAWIATFALALEALKTPTRRSIPSIAEGNPRNESL